MPQVSRNSIQSPCIGLCSVTYGDTVCRGCYRYAHEVAQWTDYTEDQRRAIMKRLDDQAEQAVRLHLPTWEIVALTQSDAPTAGQSGRFVIRNLRRISRQGGYHKRHAPPLASDAAALLARITRTLLLTAQTKYRAAFRKPKVAA